jgi:hypothetical protein
VIVRRLKFRLECLGVPEKKMLREHKHPRGWLFRDGVWVITCLEEKK